MNSYDSDDDIVKKDTVAFKFAAISLDNKLLEILRRLEIVSLAYNFFYVTLAFAWPCEMQSPIPLALSYLGDFVTATSEITQLFLEYEEEFGSIVKDPSKIAKRYLFQHCGVVRLVCCIPWELIALFHAVSAGACYGAAFKTVGLGNGQMMFDLYNAWSLIRLLKSVFPMLVLFSSLGKVRIPHLMLHYNRLIKNLVMFILCSHVSACLFWFVSVSSNSFDSWVRVNQYLVDSDGASVTFLTQYLRSLLAAEKALIFYARDNSTIDSETTYSVVETLFAALVYGSIFGNIAIIMKHLDKEQMAQDKAKLQRSKVDNMRNYMAKNRFPADLQDKIIASENYRFEKTQGIDEQTIFDDLPRSLRQDVANSLNLEMVSKVSFLQGADEGFLNSIAGAIKPVTVLQGCYIFRQDEYAQEMYFIRSGCVDILSKTGFKLCTLKPGSYFGEIAIIEGCKRTASAFAPVNTDLCILRKVDFEQLLDVDTYERLMVTVAQFKERDRLKKIADAVAKGEVLPPTLPQPAAASLLVRNDSERSKTSFRRVAAKKGMHIIRSSSNDPIEDGFFAKANKKRQSAADESPFALSVAPSHRISVVESSGLKYSGANISPASSTVEIADDVDDDNAGYVAPAPKYSAVKRGSIMVSNFFDGVRSAASSSDAPNIPIIIVNPEYTNGDEKRAIEFYDPEQRPQIDEILDDETDNIKTSFENLRFEQQQSTTIFGNNYTLRTSHNGNGKAKALLEEVCSSEDDPELVKKSIKVITEEITKIDEKRGNIIAAIALLEMMSATSSSEPNLHTPIMTLGRN